MPISFQNIKDPRDLTVWCIDDRSPEDLSRWLKRELPEGVNFETALHPEDFQQKLHAKPELTKYNFFATDGAMEFGNVEWENKPETQTVQDHYLGIFGVIKENFDRLVEKGGRFFTAVYSQGFGTRPDDFTDAEKNYPLDLPSRDTTISDVFLEGVPENMVTINKSDNPVPDFLKALSHFDRLIAL